MRTFNKQAASLKKNLKQNNLMPLFVVFSVIVMLSLTYKSVSKVNGVGNTMFKEGNRNRRRNVRQGFREGNDDDDDDDDDEVAEHFDDKGGEVEEMIKRETATTQAVPSPEGFLNGGGIGRKAGFVGREGMSASDHMSEHEKNKRLQRIVFNANKDGALNRVSGGAKKELNRMKRRGNKALNNVKRKGVKSLKRSIRFETKATFFF